MTAARKKTSLSEVKRRAVKGIERLMLRLEKVEARYKRNQTKLGLMPFRRSQYGQYISDARRKFRALQSRLIGGRVPLATCLACCSLGRVLLKTMELTIRHGTPTGKDGAKELVLRIGLTKS